MSQHDDEQLSVEEIQAERDAVRQELADLRAWLSVKLGLVQRGSGPQGLTVLTVASDREIMAKIEQLIDSAGS